MSESPARTSAKNALTMAAWICAVVLLQVPGWEIAEAHPEMKRYLMAVAFCSYLSGACFLWALTLATRCAVGEAE